MEEALQSSEDQLETLKASCREEAQSNAREEWRAAEASSEVLGRLTTLDAEKRERATDLLALEAQLRERDQELRQLDETTFQANRCLAAIHAHDEESQCVRDTMANKFKEVSDMDRELEIRERDMKALRTEAHELADVQARKCSYMDEEMALERLRAENRHRDESLERLSALPAIQEEAALLELSLIHEELRLAKRTEQERAVHAAALGTSAAEQQLFDFGSTFLAGSASTFAKILSEDRQRTWSDPLPLANSNRSRPEVEKEEPTAADRHDSNGRELLWPLQGAAAASERRTPLEQQGSGSPFSHDASLDPAPSTLNLSTSGQQNSSHSSQTLRTLSQIRLSSPLLSSLATVDEACPLGPFDELHNLVPLEELDGGGADMCWGASSGYSDVVVAAAGPAEEGAEAAEPLPQLGSSIQEEFDRWNSEMQSLLRGEAKGQDGAPAPELGSRVPASKGEAQEKEHRQETRRLLEFCIEFQDRERVEEILLERLAGLTRDDGGEITISDAGGAEVSPARLLVLNEQHFPLSVRHSWRNTAASSAASVVKAVADAGEATNVGEVTRLAAEDGASAATAASAAAARKKTDEHS